MCKIDFFLPNHSFMNRLVWFTEVGVKQVSHSSHRQHSSKVVTTSFALCMPLLLPSMFMYSTVPSVMEVYPEKNERPEWERAETVGEKETQGVSGCEQGTLRSLWVCLGSAKPPNLLSLFCLCHIYSFYLFNWPHKVKQHSTDVCTCVCMWS